MSVEFHRQIASDISRITDYYEEVAGPKLATEFHIELQTFFQKAANSPEAYDIRARLEACESRDFHIIFSVPYYRQPGAHHGCSSPPETPSLGRHRR